VRVLLVNDLPPGPTGGAEVHVGRLADALTDEGCEVETFFGDGTHTGWRRVLDLWDPRARRSIRQVVRTFAPDVVHYHNVTNELSPSVLGTGVPSVLTVHDPRILGQRFGRDGAAPRWAPGAVLRQAKDRWARTRILRAVGATIVPNAALAADARRVGLPDVHHIENLTPVHPGGPPGPDVLFVGSLSEHKGPQVLLEAWRQASPRCPGAVLRIVGDGPLGTVLAERARALRPDARVELVGSVAPDQVPALLAAAALVVVPSLGAENCPMVVLEAMAAGRPVVATDWDGVQDAVDDEVGVVVPRGDVPALAAVLTSLLGDAPRLVRLGSAARSRATQRWAPHVVAPRIVEVYRSVQP
jgi:glycosyltransferase involved in cell wall biosynthesis